MNADDIVFFIFVFIFFILPVLKRIIQIFSAIAGPAKEGPNQEEIRQYFEKIRSEIQQDKNETQVEQSGYRAPATRPQPQVRQASPPQRKQMEMSAEANPYDRLNTSGTMAEEYSYSMDTQDSQDSQGSKGKFDNIEKAVEHDIYSRGQFNNIEQSVSRHMGRGTSRVQKTNKAYPEVTKLKDLVSENKNLTDLQKIMVLKDVFDKPITLRS